MPRLAPTIDFYRNNSKIKWIVLAISILISAGSIFYTERLVSQLKEREKQQVVLFAMAIESTVNQDVNTDVQITLEILTNTSIPTILVDAKDSILYIRNVSIDSSRNQQYIDQQIRDQLEVMAETYDPITILLKDPTQNNEVFGQQKLYYKNSFLLTQINAYPYIQLSVIAIFGIISYMAFNFSRMAEQNRVWVGLAKETAHQLGTPLSSLMAWMEVLRDDPDLKNKGIADELEKDIRKLTVVTERFSSIGSVPVLRQENVVALVNTVVNYLRPRISSKVKMDVFTLSENIQVMVHPPLFEWVIENLCKNAVDAIGGSGTIAIKILRGSDSKVFIDISDTGKGIPRSKISMVFRPGFTTKKRGWGLGLTLAKRIIEAYHNGKIFVKSSEENQGTTFRIALNTVS
ncbi:MAG TPA: HAMP domain-containing sensor histidine kinase [Cyclobacteriaceae bacterium]|nr:HAMP domain-containing histidine kinase [Cyclobacteriaceae bacterium]HMV08310.1 HAMP domain-containing sensor histidine kinase [Cyclobacteriaceae bacterium]HMV88413.1 HAMP domain-containing sensor histidine kinase [Cyclobacteriaceae bacterium]HMX02153.1 HAMP domain-containing sensor histidine kinase [Cyclobacteriaceae bacterium]HMX49871.1 HAMP domain-containing sensor histidine kinase [Cyclobacteriaceae bacterium]